MEYGKLLSRSVSIVWENKFLILIGLIASLASGVSSGSGSGGGTNDSAGGIPPLDDEFAVLAIGLFIGLFCVVLVIFFVLWAIGTIARGGLIASVDTIESGEKSGFRHSWSAGWQRAGTLLGIGILPAIPGLVLFLLGFMALGAYGGLFALLGEDFAPIVGAAGLGTLLALAACVILPIMLVLSILRNFAERACMLENYGVIDSYRRGTSVLMANLGQAIILILLQIGLFIALGLLLFLPGLIALLCCCLWPLLLLVTGAVEAFVSAYWTLAWRTWTGEPQLVEKAPTAV